jgi:hypothetical protein
MTGGKDMLAARGYYDGNNCIRLLEPLAIKKNQAVIVKVIEEKQTAPYSQEDSFLQALRDDSFVIPTGLDVTEYMRELRENDRL